MESNQNLKSSHKLFTFFYTPEKFSFLFFYTIHTENIQYNKYTVKIAKSKKPKTNRKQKRKNKKTKKKRANKIVDKNKKTRNL